MGRLNEFKFNQEVVDKVVHEADKCSNKGETSFIWHSDMDDNTKFVIEKMGYTVDVLKEYTGFSKVQVSW